MNAVNHLRAKLTVDEIIENMKRKGITFKYVSDEYAKDYLSAHTYYFKLKAYAKNYVKNTTRGKYIQLDFSYLKDLATLDMYFRELIFKMTVDIEHFAKVQIMTRCQQEPSDDGYTVVSDFLAQNEDTKSRLERHPSGKTYNSKLIEKYQDNLPIWVFLEVITFGELTRFYDFYSKRFAFQKQMSVSSFLWSVRMLRNAAAHNSCILNRLTEFNSDERKTNYELRKHIKTSFVNIDGKDLKHFIMNPVVQDFFAVLTAFKILDKSRIVLKQRMSDLKQFLRRCRKHASYYKYNSRLRGIYCFICSFVKEYEKSIFTAELLGR